MKRLIFILFLLLPAVALAEEGWSSFGGDGSTPALAATPEIVQAQRTFASIQAKKEDAPPVAGVPGPKGDKGDKGDTGDTGPQGNPGVDGDVCQNIPGIQTVPGFKVWPQRYWSFKPKKEKRYFTLNAKRQLVCVTQSWIKKHGVKIVKQSNVRSLSSAQSFPRGFDFTHFECMVKNPPYAPNVLANSDIVVGTIQNRCRGIVYKLGAYGCIEFYGLGKSGKSIVHCAVKEVYFKTALVLHIDHDGVRTWNGKPIPKNALWRVTGYVWVDYEPGPTGFYRSQSVVSAWVPLPVVPFYAGIDFLGPQLPK